MSDELLNILSNSNKDIDNQKLMDYLSGKLSAVEKHNFEKILVDSEMLNDAVEGLEKIKNKNVSALVEQLNTSLHKHLEKKKLKKAKRRLTDPWLYLSIILIILIIVISFIVIRKHLETEKTDTSALYSRINFSVAGKKIPRNGGDSINQILYQPGVTL